MTCERGNAPSRTIKPRIKPQLPIPTTSRNHHNNAQHIIIKQDARARRAPSHSTQHALPPCDGLVSSHITAACVSYAYAPRRHLTTLLRNLPNKSPLLQSTQGPAPHLTLLSSSRAVDLRTRGNGHTSEVVSASIESASAAIILPVAAHNGHESPPRITSETGRSVDR